MSTLGIVFFAVVGVIAYLCIGLIVAKGIWKHDKKIMLQWKNSNLSKEAMDNALWFFDSYESLHDEHLAIRETPIPSSAKVFLIIVFWCIIPLFILLYFAVYCICTLCETISAAALNYIEH